MKKLRLLILFPLIIAATLAGFSSADASSLFERSKELLALRVKQADPNDYTFVVLGDSRGNVPIFRKVMTKAASLNPVFILHTGDISDHGTRGETEHFIELVTEILPKIPLFVVVGNHESDKNVFEELIGPRNFVIDNMRLNSQLVAVDNADYTLKPVAYDYLREHMKSRRGNNFIAMHIPPKTAKWDWHTFNEGADKFLKFAAEAKPDMLFFAHVHQYAEDIVAGIPAIITGGAGAPLYDKGKFPGEPVYHLVVVRVKNGRVCSEMIKVD